MKSAVEIEKKYVVKIPELEALKSLEGYSESEIVQIYIESPRGLTHRVRKRTSDSVSVFTETRKQRIDSMSSFEDEREIDESRFLELSAKMRSGSAPVTKKRITFMHGERLFELDIYPQWKQSCIMEVELPERETTVDFPPFVELIEDVTGRKEYSNSSMSMAFPPELL